MVLTRTLETAFTGRFLTIYFFLHFWGPEPEPAEPEPAESGVVTEPLEPNRLDQEPTRTEPNRPFPVFWRALRIGAAIRTPPTQSTCETV